MTAPAPMITETIATEFPDWELSAVPSRNGMWQAWWISEDGRSRHIVMAQTLVLLLTHLRKIRDGSL